MNSSIATLCRARDQRHTAMYTATPPDTGPAAVLTGVAGGIEHAAQDISKCNVESVSLHAL